MFSNKCERSNLAALNSFFLEFFGSQIVNHIDISSMLQSVNLQPFPIFSFASINILRYLFWLRR
jgi:hypothetical protein